MYDLIDKNLKDYYIKGHKCVFLVGLCLSLILGILSFFYTAALVLLVVFAVITLTFFITWNKNKKKYGKKLSFNNDTITIYDYKNFKINEFQIEDLNSSYMKISFDEYPRFSYKSCLILYTDFELHENMKPNTVWGKSQYSLLCSQPNVEIIQNPELIGIISKILK